MNSDNIDIELTQYRKIFSRGEKENTWQLMQKRVLSKIDNAIA